MKVLIDANILLDVVMRRPGFFASSASVWQAAEEKKFEAVITATSFTTIHYIVGKYSGLAAANNSIEILTSFSRSRRWPQR